MLRRKGIVLAGGLGTRLYPLTMSVSKHLLPIYDKPMIYYSLSVLMLAGIQDILIISTPQYIDQYKQLLEDGSRLGMDFSYAVQPKPEGIAQAFLIGESFINGAPSALILGDNFFYSYRLSEILKKANENIEGATIFSYAVDNPSIYGVIELDKAGQPLNIIEKPANPRSYYAVTGLYFYDKKVTEIAKKIKPSARGELEITDINQHYLDLNQLNLIYLGRGSTWLDSGTHDSLLQANQFVATLEKRQGLKIACLEEIAYRCNYITRSQFTSLINDMTKSHYKEYFLKILAEEGTYPAYEI